MLLAGMVLGKAASLLLGPMFPYFKLGTELFRDSLITIAIFLTAILISEGLGKIQAYHAGRLLLASTVGATGLALGAILSMGLALLFWNDHPAINQNAHWQAWTQLVDWVTVVTNGWIGDSSSLVPIMLTLENSAGTRRPLLCDTGNLGMAPAFLLDWAVTLPWFVVALKVARPSKLPAAAPESASHASETPRISWRSKWMIVGCGSIGGITMCLLAHHPHYRSSFLRPLYVILLYSVVASLGLMAGQAGLAACEKVVAITGPGRRRWRLRHHSRDRHQSGRNHHVFAYVRAASRLRVWRGCAAVPVPVADRRTHVRLQLAPVGRGIDVLHRRIGDRARSCRRLLARRDRFGLSVRASVDQHPEPAAYVRIVDHVLASERKRVRPAAPQPRAKFQGLTADRRGFFWNGCNAST